MTAEGIGERLPEHGRGEVFIAWTDEGPRIATTGRSVLITVPLLALVEAGDSPWAELRETGVPGDGDPFGWRGAALRIEADGRTLVYRIAEYLPVHRCYAADLQDETGAAGITA
jgi:hypothetical protein